MVLGQPVESKAKRRFEPMGVAGQKVPGLLLLLGFDQFFPHLTRSRTHRSAQTGAIGVGSLTFVGIEPDETGGYLDGQGVALQQADDLFCSGNFGPGLHIVPSKEYPAPEL